MISEIGKDFYCSAKLEGRVSCNRVYFVEPEECKRDITVSCSSKHHKWPTPEQFKEEYGIEYPDEGAAYALMVHGMAGIEDWVTVKYGDYCEDGEPIVCACTPFGKPDKNWRP